MPKIERNREKVRENKKNDSLGHVTSQGRSPNMRIHKLYGLMSDYVC